MDYDQSKRVNGLPALSDTLISGPVDGGVALAGQLQGSTRPPVRHHFHPEVNSSRGARHTMFRDVVRLKHGCRISVPDSQAGMLIQLNLPIWHL